MMRGGRGRLLLILAGGLVLAAALTVSVHHPYYLRLLTLAAINVILATSVNLLVGYTGQVSLAQAGFFGIGAYVSALLSVRAGLSFWVTMPVAALSAAVAGVLLGLPTLRLKGHYLSIATLGFGIVVHTILVNWVPVTGGPMGVLGIPSPVFLGLDLGQGNRYLFFAVFMATLVIAGVAALLDSPWGRAFAAIKEDEIFAQVAGINTYLYKVTAFAISSGLAGVAGSLYAHYITFISPEGFDLPGSIEILITAIAGGLGTLPGPVLGAVGLMFLSEALREARELRMILYGTLLWAIILFVPQGIYPGIRQWLRGRRAPAPEAAASPYLRASLWRGFRSLTGRADTPERQDGGR